MSTSSSNKSGTRMPLAITALGVILVLVSIFADSIGLSGGGEGYGWKQLLATIVGLVIFVSGLGWAMRDRQLPNR